MRVGVDIDGTVARAYPLILGALGLGRAEEFRGSGSYDLRVVGVEEGSFFRAHPWIFRFAEPEPGAAEVLGHLAARGAEVFYVSSRPPWAEGVTRGWLARWGFPPGQLVLVSDKARAAVRLGLDCFLEDSPENLLALSGVVPAVLRREQPYNAGLPGRPFAGWHLVPGLLGFDVCAVPGLLGLDARRCAVDGGRLLFQQPGGFAVPAPVPV